ncbi:hypothetical protein F2Q70_00009383 [Brassica cretica]|uniref:Uncharacterized protein n=1 Tax=Brassica cretica TaxID=69181 RepID=A0A8S9M9Q8_BRACR|nr:hypothetical protein F2Q70_00009383 [Brassica cretica]
MPESSQTTWQKPPSEALLVSIAADLTLILPCAFHADLLSLCWAAHNMKDLQQKRVIFEFSSGPLSNALRSPEAFSLYNPLFQDLQLSLIGLESWSLRYVPSHENLKLQPETSIPPATSMICSSCPTFLTYCGIRRSFPWVLWNLWKARNTLLFERTNCSALSISIKATEDADAWFQANMPESSQTTWQKPPSEALLVSIAADLTLILPCAFHADLLSLCWAAHNMKDLQQKRVIFEFSSGPLSNALRSPEAFSLYNPLFQDLQLSLIGLESWSLRYVPSHENLVALRLLTV